MSEKVKLKREVAEAIETLRTPSNGFSNYAIIGMMNDHRESMKEIVVINNHMGQGKMHPDDLIAALVNGYEVEETPEEKVRRYYENHAEKVGNGKTVVLNVLHLLEIQIEGVNA